MVNGKALDFDCYATKEVDLYSEMDSVTKHIVVVNDDWSFPHLREHIII